MNDDNGWIASLFWFLINAATGAFAMALFLAITGQLR